MHLIAHRGWATGGDEISLAAFARAARDEALTGVEFEVSRAADSGTVVVSHDPPLYTENALTLDAALSFLSRTDLELFVELKEQGLATSVIDKLVSNKLADRSVMFAFAAVARSFPWQAPTRPVRLGVIVMYPWNLDRLVRLYAPEFLLLGWDARSWTRIAFRAWWSLFSIKRLAGRHQVPVVVGVAQRRKDLDWLAPQHVYGAVADISLIRGDQFQAEQR